MNTATYHKNVFITDRFKIIRIYLKEYFFFEILPLILENLKPSSLVLRILFYFPLLLKIKGMHIIFKNLEFYIL
jgi:hypothetical protein